MNNETKLKDASCIDYFYEAYLSALLRLEWARLDVKYFHSDSIGGKVQAKNS